MMMRGTSIAQLVVARAGAASTNLALANLLHQPVDLSVGQVRPLLAQLRGDGALALGPVALEDQRAVLEQFADDSALGAELAVRHVGQRRVALLLLQAAIDALALLPPRYE